MSEVQHERAKAVRREGPGRPEGQSGLKDEILDVAEAAFADTRFSGTSLRMLAERAGVTTALINYYFGSKFELFEAVYKRGSSKVASARMTNIHALEANGQLGDPTALIRAFVQPVIELRKTPEGRSFLKLQWAVDTEPKELSFMLRGKAYDESTHAYARALHRAQPNLTLEQAYARLIIVIGATLYASSVRNRFEELLPEHDAEAGSDLILNEISEFISKAMVLV